MQSKINHYKLEHNKLLKEVVLWKINLNEMEKSMHEVATKKEDMREQCRNNCHANVVIENVLPFLYKFDDV